jgi:hypothetical protein
MDLPPELIDIELSALAKFLRQRKVLELLRELMRRLEDLKVTRLLNSREPTVFVLTEPGFEPLQLQLDAE